MKNKVVDIAFRYLILMLAFLPVILVLRIAEYKALSHAPALQLHPLAIEATGMLVDLKAFFTLALVLFIPFLLLSLLHRRSAEIIYGICLCLLAILQFSLIRYFSINLSPLGAVIYRYSFSEILMIIRNSNDFNLQAFLPVVLVPSLVIILQVAVARVRISGRSGTLLTATFLIGLFLSLFNPDGVNATCEEHTNPYKINKSAYFLNESLAFLFREKPPENEEEIGPEIEQYHKIHPEFRFTSDKYPLMHRNTTPDVLGPYFNLGEKPPNLVFIIVESLSSAVIGEQSWYGNFAPFLDSLKNHSLYWDNFLSISERTFHVFASVFGSLPFGNGEFQLDASQIPVHYSLIRYLKENGYYTGVYYGGDLNFTNYNEFFRKEGTDFLMNYFGPEYREQMKRYPDFYWGYHDEFTFARSLEVIDSLNKEPRLDIYLTLSTHHPFNPPRAENYRHRYEAITSQPGYPPEKKKLTDQNAAIFSSILYTDDALRSFFQTYSEREDYANTIFFITGDHFFMELGYSSISAIERYHVPLIIYSPLVKEPHHFTSVSSHHDIAPSLIAMLQNKYHFEENLFVHWLGQGIDTSTAFRNIQTVQFVTNDFEKVDFLKGNYFLSKGRLYTLKPGLQTQPVTDDRKLGELKEDLKITSTVTQYANENDRIVLEELFRMIRYDTTRIFTFDTSGLKFGKEPNLFIRVMRPFRFDTSYWKIGYDLKFNYMIRDAADTAKLPGLIVSVEDSTSANLLYHPVPFPGFPSTGIKPGTWYPFHRSEVLDVRFIDSLRGKIMKVYFFNNRLSNIRLDSVKISIEGVN